MEGNGAGIPSPYRAALALSIDCDGCTVERLNQVFRYWTTDLGLPVASSMFLYSRNPSAPPQASYLDGDRDGLLDAYRRGWIDTLHSLGDFAGQTCTREMARRAFDALAADGVRIQVWTNHGGPENVHNLVRENARGDVPGSDCYLSDLACDYGIRYVWGSHLTHLIGQDRRASPAEYYATYPERSGLVRMATRFLHPVGEWLVRRLNVEPFRDNRLLFPWRLRDGRPVWRFLRYGRWRFDTISRLPHILPLRVLDALEESGGAMIVYLHIGPSRDETPEDYRAGLRALDEVARRFRERKTLWVARTSDVLRQFSGGAHGAG
jgi:hypothetical protein